ncbi:MAG: methyltransferase domain-containing protein [Thermodesulfobacteriota bacterium]|nr:methyltransferase domain-containing protein [Thermodesulfobacteriota bacterium]
MHHIDDAARQHLKAIYRKKLKPGYRVLDLMAGWESHIPENPGLASVHGIWLNESELSANTSLTSYSVQDLNLNPVLEFKADSFDAVICSLSVEYLTDPVKLFKEVCRVLKPGKTFAVSFSNRWFPTKSIRVWKDLHEFERTGLVLEYFLQAEGYTGLETRSIRGYPRPEHDKYADSILLSDPVYTVTGQKN